MNDADRQRAYRTAQQVLGHDASWERETQLAHGLIAERVETERLGGVVDGVSAFLALRAKDTDLRAVLADVQVFIAGIRPAALDVPCAFRLRTAPSNVEWDPMNPRAELIHVEYIARSLALQCRFGGHLGAFYSVAQHCVLVSHLVEPAFAFAGLMHEVAKALSGFGDIVGTVKRVPHVAAVVKPIERAIDDAASVRFGLPIGFASCPEVKRGDHLAYAIEDFNLRGIGAPQPDLLPLPWQAAEALLLARFAELGGVPS
jgi:hypothetical protein